MSSILVEWNLEIFFLEGRKNRESGEKPSEKQEPTTLIQIILDKVL